MTISPKKALKSMKSYRSLRSRTNPVYGSRIMEELSEIPIFNCSGNDIKILGKSFRSCDLISCAQQRFVQKYSGYKLIADLQIAINYNETKLGLPVAWLNFLNNKYSLRRSSYSKLFWIMRLIYIFVFELFRCFNFILKFYYLRSPRIDPSPRAKSVYLDGFETGCFKNEDSTWSVLSHIRKWYGENTRIFHNTKCDNSNKEVEYIDNFHHLLTGELKVSRMLVILYKILVQIIFEVQENKALCFFNVYQLFLCSILNDYAGNLGRFNIVFNNSSYIHKPLWTILLEEEGSTVEMVFLSTNIEYFNTVENFDTRAHFGYKIMTWKSFIVWDETQKDFLVKVCGVASDCIKIVGPINNFGEKFHMPGLGTRAGIAVFDVHPLRPVFASRFGLEQDYYNESNMVSFIVDIANHCAENGITVLLKGKREVDLKVFSKKYDRIVSELEKRGLVIRVNSAVSPFSMAQEVIGAISIPYTSTALIFSHLEKKSVFYDPSISLKTTNCSRGIPLICGQVELRDWLSALKQNL